MTPFLDDGDLRVYLGHVLDVLGEMPDASVDCIVTSPPYFGLRDYGLEPVTWPDGWEGQHGLEPTVAMYVEHQRMVWAELRRVLAPHGTAWLNLGDSYAGSWGAQGRGGPPSESSTLRGNGHVGGGPKLKTLSDVQIAAHPATTSQTGTIRDAGLKPKDLIGLPWRVAFALQDDGWWLRAENVWHKPNPMPESVTDRTTRAHESVFHLTRSARYWYDAEAVKAPASEASIAAHINRSVSSPRPKPAATIPPGHPTADHPHHHHNGTGLGNGPTRDLSTANLRSVWSIPTVPFPEAHFAVFPPKLPRTCIRAGCPLEVCRTCGVPRERIVEREAVDFGMGAADVADHKLTQTAQGATPQRQRTPTGHSLVSSRNGTTGWTDCGHGDYRPGVVLDPFAGSGPTLMVAREEGRHGIGIEASPEYAEMIAKRTQQLGLGVA